MYKSKRRIAVCILAVLLTLCAACVAGCHKKPPETPNGPENPDNPPAVLTPAINETAIELHIGEEFTLTVSNTDEEIEWQSDDGSVATVSQEGVVKAVGLGNATVKAYVGDDTLSCAVSVVIKYEAVPKIVLKNEVSYEGEYQLNLTLNYEYFLHPVLQVGDSEAEVTFALSTESTALTADSAKMSVTATEEADCDEITVSCVYNEKTYSVTLYVSASEVE